MADISEEFGRFFHHIIIFYLYKDIYIRINTELKEGDRLNYINQKIAKNGGRNYQLSKANNGGFFGVFSPFKKRDSFNGCSNMNDKLDEIEVNFCIECDKCGNRLTEYTRAKNELLEYSFTRYLEALAMNA